jgi:transposase
MEENRALIIQAVMKFLGMFMCETLVKRIVSLLMLSFGVPHQEITELTGLCDRSVRELKKRAKNGELESLFVLRSGSGRPGKLRDVESLIVAEIDKNNYHSRQEIADMILEKYKIKISLPAIGRLLKKNEIKRLKCGSLPAKADPVKQRTFYETILYSLMTRASRDEIALLFVDASHFVMGCDFLGYIYGKVRRFIKTYSGRKRYNVLGALNFVSKKMTTITNDTYITSLEVCDLLRKICAEYAGKPIYVILDNASYQKCTLVQNLAMSLGINLVYIPSYSPNLNLIERLWKFVKAELRTKYYDNFDVFIDKINSIIDSVDKHNKYLIDKLIGDKVQLFDDIDHLIDISIPVNKNVKIKRVA